MNVALTIKNAEVERPTRGIDPQAGVAEAAVVLQARLGLCGLTCVGFSSSSPARRSCASAATSRRPTSRWCRRLR